MKYRRSPENRCLFSLIKAIGWGVDWKEDAIWDIIKGDTSPGENSLEAQEILHSFFSYLQEIGITSLFKRTQPSNYRRVMVPIHLLLHTYLAKTLTGISSMNALPRLLFSHPDLMQAIGFSPSHLEQGICRRGEHGRKREKKAPIPFSPQMLSNFIERFTQHELENLFYAVIQRITAQHLFPVKMCLLFDTVQLQTTERHQGCGEKTITRKEIRNNGLVDKTDSLYGFQLTALLDWKTRIPLSIQLLKIQEQGEISLPHLLQKAQENLGEKYPITHLTSRVPLSQENLIYMNRQGLYFYSPIELDPCQQTKKLTGGGKTMEEHPSSFSPIMTRTLLDDLKQEEGLEHLQTVVIKGANPGYADEGGDIFLTNDPGKAPPILLEKLQKSPGLQTLLYQKDRPGWHLQKPPKKNQETMSAHVFLTMITYALSRAYQEHRKS